MLDKLTVVRTSAEQIWFEWRRNNILCAAIACTLVLSACGSYSSPPASRLMGSGFRQSNLVADIEGQAARTDPFLLNPWGLAFQPGQSFWIADNSRSSAKVFDSSGNATIPSTVLIPSLVGSAVSSAPTGIVFNPVAQDFMVRGTPAQFLFATESGAIFTWSAINGDFPTS